MAKARVTTTNTLSNVIEVVELGQRTGLLSVERGAGSVQETGDIFFVLGRPIYASLAGLRGREALAALSRWGACRFSFDRDAPQPAPNLSPPPSQPGQAGYSGYSGGAQHGPPGHTPSSHPGMAGTPYSNPAPRPFESSAGWPMPTGMGGGGSGYAGTPTPAGTDALSGWGTPQGPGSQVPGAYDSFHNPQPIPNTPSQYGNYNGNPYGGSQGGPQQGQAPQMAGPLARRPRRAPDVRDLMTIVTSHNLSRGHRTLLLLADGEHSVLDLARLSSKSVDEVMSLLADLEVRSLIYYYG